MEWEARIDIDIAAAKKREDDFADLVANCDFDAVFADVDRDKFLILRNIEEIAGNFSEGNEFQANPETKLWLYEALKNAGAEIILTD